MINIREAIPQDATLIRKIQRLTWLDTYVSDSYGISREDIESKEFESVKSILEMSEGIKKGEWKTFVAEYNSEIVGFCSVYREKDNKDNVLGGTYVLPEFQNMGIGKLLVKKGLQYLGTKNPVTCEVAKYNKKSLDYWKKFGFNIIGDSQYNLPNGQNFPLYILKKEL